MLDDARMLIDTKYVEDTTTIYVKSNTNNLDTLQNAIDEFCKGSGAKIN